jgi:hypothetical protein
MLNTKKSKFDNGKPENSLVLYKPLEKSVVLYKKYTEGALILYKKPAVSIRKLLLTFLDKIYIYLKQDFDNF